MPSCFVKGGQVPCVGGQDIDPQLIRHTFFWPLHHRVSVPVSVGRGYLGPGQQYWGVGNGSSPSAWLSDQ